MAKRKPAEPKATPKPKAVSKAKGKTPLDSMIEAGDKLATADPFVPNEFGVIPPQTGETGLTIKGVPLVFVPGESETMQDAISKAVSSANPKTEKNEQTDEKSTQDASESPQLAATENEKNTGNRFQQATETTAQENPGLDEGTEQAPQSTNSASNKNRGNVVIPDASADLPVKSLETLLPSHARLPGEGRAAFWERTRKALRALGIPRGQGPGTAYEMATRAAEREFPPPVPVIVQESPEAEAEPVPEPLKPVPEAIAAPVQADGSVSGLSNFPESWPKLPANAQLQAEIAWVTANRLLVRDGTGVNLSRAMSPPPSYSALSWLETSILFPAKFADISVKATAENDDEKEFIRREKMAVEEIRSILKEMRDAKGT